MQLKDERARAVISSCLDRLAYGHAGDAEPIRGVALMNYVSTTVLGIAFTFKSEGVRLLFCYVEAIRAHKQMTSKKRNVWQMNGVNEMTEKLTTYDPAEDLASEEAIAIFMAEAFKTGDTGYIAHALGVVARAKLRAKQGFPGSNFIDLLASEAIRP